MTRALLLPVVLLLLAAALAGLSVGDRSSPLALQILEWETRLGLRLWWAPAAAGLGLLGRALLGGRSRPGGGARATRPSPRPRPAASPPPEAASADELRTAVQALRLPAGARLLVEDRGTAPLRLVLEQCTEHRARRAVEQVAALVSAGACPPRLRIDIRDCPRPTTPWHHIVAAALATALPRGDVKVTRQTDGVDVVFLKPHPSWRTG